MSLFKIKSLIKTSGPISLVNSFFTPSINISAVQTTDCFIDVLAKTTSDFDLIEYKINTEDWKPYTDTFRVYKIPRKQFIQARIKQDRYLLLLKCYL